MGQEVIMPGGIRNNNILNRQFGGGPEPQLGEEERVSLVQPPMNNNRGPAP